VHAADFPHGTKEGAISMERTATSNATTVDNEVPSETETVVVHVQLRPRRGASRKCLAALAALAAQHESAAFAVSGVSKDDRVVKITVGVELGPRSAIAKFSPQAQAAYAFVSAIFTSLYDHMPVYAAEPSAAERKAAATLLEAAARGGVVAGLPEAVLPSGTVAAELVPVQRAAGPAERISV
jgi:hypothetical protein